MLIYAALATLLCSSLIDARLAPVNTSDDLALCKDQPYCKNPALEISESTFHPTIKASREMKLNLTVKSKQPLSFTVHSENSDKWTIKRPDNKCKWVFAEAQGRVSFAELDGEGKATDAYGTCRGSELNIAFRSEGDDTFFDVTGKSCDEKSQKLTCTYARPDSVSIKGWDIWTLVVSAEPDTSTAIITLKDAYVVYDAPEPTMTTDNGTLNGTTHDPNSTTTIHNVTNTTPDAALSATTWGLIGGCGIFFLLFVVAAVMASIFFRKTRKLCNKPDPQTLKKIKEQLLKEGWRQDDPSRTATEDRYCVQEDTCLESRSKRLEDENKVAAAETAQKPAPAEGQPEPKSQEVKGAAGTSNQPAADPQKNA